MKLVLTLLLLAAPVHAAPFGAELHGPEIDRLLASGRALKRTGQVLVGIGCVAALAATVVGPFGYMQDHTSSARFPDGGSPFGALEQSAVGLGVGTALSLAVGIALMAEGDARVARAHVLVGSTAPRWAWAPNGLAVTW